MNARERVLAVLNRETPDRVPVDIWLVPELVEKFKQKLGVDNELDVYRKLDIDKIAWHKKAKNRKKALAKSPWAFTNPIAKKEEKPLIERGKSKP